MSDGNVTRIHPAPSIPNPLVTNPWAAATTSDLEQSLVAALSRADAAMHTVRSIQRELHRRGLDPVVGDGDE